MKELEFIEIINKTLSKNSHLGDDCAYLKDLEIVVTHDSLVEDVHFSTRYCSPYELGYKSIIVNISDILASGAIPKYVTISLSLPKSTENNFVEEFYKACEDLSKKFNLEVIGGDITGSEKIFVSVCAIGVTKDRNISSRSYAKAGDVVVVSGNHGSSAAGLWLLSHNSNEYKNLQKEHLMPDVKKYFSDEASTKVGEKYAMMDTSDGLADALFKIACSSDVKIFVNPENIPYDKEIEDVAKKAGVSFYEWILYGGEDFQLVACIDEESLAKLDKSTYNVIGKVCEKTDDCYLEIKWENEVEKICDLEKTYNHFGRKNEI